MISCFQYFNSVDLNHRCLETLVHQWSWQPLQWFHMSVMDSQISNKSTCSKKHQQSVLQALCEGLSQLKAYTCYDVIMTNSEHGLRLVPFCPYITNIDVSSTRYSAIYQHATQLILCTWSRFNRIKLSHSSLLNHLRFTQIYKCI